MPSPRTDPPATPRLSPDWSSFDPRGLGAWAARLNTRLVLALALVTLVGLLTSGIAIPQILPGYFAQQTEQRIEDATASTALSLREAVTRVGNDPTGRTDAQLRELDQRAKSRYVSPVAQAGLYVTLGNTDRAFEWLEKAYQDRRGWLAYLRIEPMLDGLRADPRFHELLDRMRLR